MFRDATDQCPQIFDLKIHIFPDMLGAVEMFADQEWDWTISNPAHKTRDAEAYRERAHSVNW
jgi:hypothetical protein